LHFLPGDANDLAEKVRGFLGHPELMARMRADARREYETKYTAETNYEQMMAIYRKLVPETDVSGASMRTPAGVSA
jgi:glycosyltransferase involved in cell wall biosynthesis